MKSGQQPTQDISISIIISAILLIATSLACGKATKPDANPLATPSASVSGEGTLIFQSSQDGGTGVVQWERHF
ncbi:MAG TPA: hypothetical protein G4N96_09370 [Chloroflexi bacterium]|nr:hypothetical protein [Chloroflexota bacterium]